MSNIEIRIRVPRFEAELRIRRKLPPNTRLHRRGTKYWLDENGVPRGVELDGLARELGVISRIEYVGD